MRFFLLLAKFPHSIKIIFSFESDIFCMIVSVKNSHPIFEWLAGIHDLTVNIAFKSKTHSVVHFSRFPLSGI
jgi:hypothetical protein